MNRKKKILRNFRKEIKSKKEKEKNPHKRNDQVIPKSEEALTKMHQLRQKNLDQKKTENLKWKKKARPQKRKQKEKNLKNRQWFTLMLKTKANLTKQSP